MTTSTPITDPSDQVRINSAPNSMAQPVEPATKPRLKRLRGARLRAVVAGHMPVPDGYVDPRS